MALPDTLKTIGEIPQEIESVKKRPKFVEVGVSSLTPEQQQRIMQPRWVIKDKSSATRERPDTTDNAEITAAIHQFASTTTREMKISAEQRQQHQADTLQRIGLQNARLLHHGLH